MKASKVAGAFAASFLIFSAGQALAASSSGVTPGGNGHATFTSTLMDLLMGNNPLGPDHPTGQPNETCGTPGALLTPGHAADARGSPFNPDGNAGTHYAGEQPQNSKNPVSVSQYDVACSNQKK